MAHEATQVAEQRRLQATQAATEESSDRPFGLKADLVPSSRALSEAILLGEFGPGRPDRGRTTEFPARSGIVLADISLS